MSELMNVIKGQAGTNKPLLDAPSVSATLKNDSVDEVEKLQEVDTYVSNEVVERTERRPQPLTSKERKAVKKDAHEAYISANSLTKRVGRYAVRLAGVWFAAGAIYGAGTTYQYDKGLTENKEDTLSWSDPVGNAATIAKGPIAPAAQFKEQVVDPILQIKQTTEDTVSDVKELF